MKIISKRLILLLPITLAFWAIYSYCSLTYDRNKKLYMFREVQPEELVGTWYFSEETCNLLKEEHIDSDQLGKEKNMLVLMKDGVINGNIILPPLGIPRKGEDRSFPLKGRWKMFYNHNGKFVENLIHAYFDEKLVDIIFHVCEDSGRLSIWKYLHDPSNFYRTYVFEKYSDDVPSQSSIPLEE